ncbi:tripartite tricarboxylate transporter substrate binding protein [Blastococcus goldschmidtiae]|uniref:Tripartite tricarboxylate transporter substrate binding protein n=1 Tax=Blastococcus goldschmidtiae TaxID=3075546 RepID=A0ABU2KB36_9ACTN|nr:tripartite tricarboxylate transporter substrate binding protein [Blastococcus sp. DSM 46792]MDT0277406.1 tripartite tricarboxylate transporter substrate binding protein [Blastococcus sp. DSM 46792]
MRPIRRTAPALIAVSVLMLAACGGDDEGGSSGGGGGEAASDYPNDSITLYVPYAAGGPTDLAARTIGSCLEEEFGETVVVENREGASGSIGMQAMLAEDADGYTLSLIAVPASATNPLQGDDVGYTNEDYIPIAAVTEIPSVLAVGADSEYEDAEAFFEAAQENPGQLNVGVPGTTTSQAMELKRMAEEYDTELTLLPFSGNAEMTAALLGGNVDAVFINSSQDVLSNIEAGKFVPLAVSTPEPVEYIDAPPLAEVGFPELTNSVSVFGLAAPAGTPDDVVSTLEDAVSTCLEKPETIEQLGEQYVPDEFIGTEAFQERIEEIVDVYGPILQD